MGLEIAEFGALVLNERTAFIIVLLLGLATVVAGFLLLLPLVHCAARLNGLRKHLPAQPEQGPEAEAKAAKTVDRVAPEFVRAWLASARVVDGHRVSPVRFSDFHPEQAAYRWSAEFRLGLVRPMSGVLLGAGILFTFLGITVGLWQVDTSNPDNLLSGVSNLLRGMNFAFVTSIAGIALSIAWTFGSRWALGRYHRSVRLTTEAVHRHLAWRPAANIQLAMGMEQGARSSRLLERALVFAEEQTELLRTLGVDIAGAVSAQFRQSLDETVTPGLERMERALLVFAEKQTAQNQESLERMLRIFQDGLGEHLQGHAERISAAMATAAESIERFHGSLTQTLERLSELSEVQEGLLHATSTAAREFNESVEGLNEIHSSLRAGVEQYHEVAQTARELAGGLRGEAQVLSDANAELRAELAEHLELVATQTRELAGSAEKFEASTQELVPRLESAVTEFTGLAADKLKEVFQAFDSELAAVTNRLNSTLHHIRVNLDELAPITADLKEVVVSTLPAASSTGVAIGALAHELEASRNVMSQLVQGLEHLEGRNASKTSGSAAGVIPHAAEGGHPPQHPSAKRGEA